MQHSQNDKFEYAALATWLAAIALVFTLSVVIIAFRPPSDAELDSAFLAGMEAGNQSCGVLVPERQRRKPLRESGGLL